MQMIWLVPAFPLIGFLLAYQNKVEIWSKENYLQMIGDEPEDFAALAEEVFRHKGV